MSARSPNSDMLFQKQLLHKKSGASNFRLSVALGPEKTRVLKQTKAIPTLWHINIFPEKCA